MGVFCKKVESGGCLLFKKVENGGGVFFFVKKVNLSSTQYLQYQYFLFYILLIWGVRTQPTHPPPAYGLGLTLALRFILDLSCNLFLQLCRN